MQYLLGFVCEPVPNVKKRAPALFIHLSPPPCFHLLALEADSRILIVRFTRGVCVKRGSITSARPTHVKAPPGKSPALQGGPFLLGAQKPSPRLPVDLSAEWGLCTHTHTHKKQSLIQQRNLNPNTAKSNIHCETCFSGELEKLPFPWKALNYDLRGVFVRLEGKRQVGGKARGKTCQPIIHFFHWYTVCTAGLTEI